MRGDWNTTQAEKPYDTRTEGWARANLQGPQVRVPAKGWDLVPGWWWGQLQIPPRAAWSGAGGQEVREEAGDEVAGSQGPRESPDAQSRAEQLC